MRMSMARGSAEKGRVTGGTVTAVPSVGWSVGGQRYLGSSSRVRETGKNLAYQPARDPLIWAAYMPRNVGPLGGDLLWVCCCVKHQADCEKEEHLRTTGTNEPILIETHQR